MVVIPTGKVSPLCGPSVCSNSDSPKLQSVSRVGSSHSTVALKRPIGALTVKLLGQFKLSEASCVFTVISKLQVSITPQPVL